MTKKLLTYGKWYVAYEIVTTLAGFGILGMGFSPL